MIKNLLETDYSAAEAGDVRNAIAQINAIDKKLMTLVENNRDRVFKALQKSDTGKKMKAAYGSTKRPY